MNPNETVPETEELPNAEASVQEGDALTAEGEEGEKKEEHRNRGSERRINRLIGERAQARAEAAQVRAEAEFYRQQVERLSQSDDDDADEGLTPEQLEAAFHAWEGERQEAARREKIAGKVNAAVKADKEFGEALDSLDVEFSPGQLSVFADAIEDGSGVALLKYLAKNPEEVEDLADLSPTQLARALVRLETKVAQAAKPKVSSAPAAIQPVKGSALASLGDPEKYAGGVEGWIQARNAQKLKR